MASWACPYPVVEWLSNVCRLYLKMLACITAGSCSTFTMAMQVFGDPRALTVVFTERVGTGLL